MLAAVAPRDAEVHEMPHVDEHVGDQVAADAPSISHTRPMPVSRCTWSEDGQRPRQRERAAFDGGHGRPGRSTSARERRAWSRRPFSISRRLGRRQRSVRPAAPWPVQPRQAAPVPAHHERILVVVGVEGRPQTGDAKAQAAIERDRRRVGHAHLERVPATGNQPAALHIGADEIDGHATRRWRGSTRTLFKCRAPSRCRATR